MANNITRMPHIVDTAAATVVVASSVSIRRVRWVGATTAGHQAIITDAADRVIWESIAPAANYVEADTVNHFANGGYKVSTLGSGKLYIELG